MSFGSDPTCRKEPQCRLPAYHHGLCAPAKLPGKYDHILKTPIYKPRSPDVAIVARSVGEAMGVSIVAGVERTANAQLCLVGSQIYGARLDEVYASVELLPLLRTPSEDEWFRSEVDARLRVGVEVTYVDVDG